MDFIDAESQLREHHAGKRVLVVDDEPLNIDVVILLLQRTGLRLDCASDGQAAVARAQEAAYSIILMDIHMPVLNGIEATRRIRQLAGGEKIPIIAVTANGSAQARKECLSAGVNDFIIKPYKPEELFSTMLKRLESLLIADGTGQQANQYLQRTESRGSDEFQF